ncbi:Crp/Fnr family transcriptional regulator [bacterium]|nr:Crp/Fnr family transcriptional regulator [candidate division CSSED10-310 bacterium]
MTTDKPKVSGGIGRRLLYRKGDRIFSEGQTGKEMYVVESGKIKIFLTAQERELTLAVLQKGDFFGEMALLEDLPRSASAAAIETTRLIAIGKDDFKFLIQEHPEIAMKVLARFSNRLRDADNLINLLLMGNIAGRLVHQLHDLAVRQYGSEDKIPRDCILPDPETYLAQQSHLPAEQVELVLLELQRVGIVMKTDEGVIVRKFMKLKSFMDYFNLMEKNQARSESML